MYKRQDFATLTVERTDLPSGRTLGSFTITLGEIIRTIHVQVEVPTASGDWKGYATTTKVNGNPISLGAVDLSLNLFMDSEEEGETLFRAVLDQEKALLFPRDVFMNGVFLTQNQFSMTTSFNMVAGDRNAPPYDTFSMPADYEQLDELGRVRNDYDANQDGVHDVTNPFPYDVRREVTLLGSRVTPDRLEGSYIESITGMLPNQEAIFIEGAFYLDRQTFEPTKRSIFNETTELPPSLIGGLTGETSKTTTITVTDDVNISGLQLNLDVSFPDPSLLTITLIGPDGRSILLHQNADILPTEFSLEDYNGQLGAGVWQLRVSWSATGERGYLNSWTLNLQGLASYQARGVIAGDLGSGIAPLADAHIVLTGNNIPQEFTTDETGSFTFTDLTENHYTLSISRPGFATVTKSFAISDHNQYIGQTGVVMDEEGLDDAIILSPRAIDEASLKAAPFITWIGEDPVSIDFSVALPLAFLHADTGRLGSLVNSVWDFGDGMASVSSSLSDEDSVGLTIASHEYQKAGVYPVSVVLTGERGSMTLESVVYVQRGLPDTEYAPDPTNLASMGPQSHQVIVSSFTGSIASPMTNEVVQVAAGSGTNVQTIQVRQADGEYTTSILTELDGMLFGSGVVYQESKWDVATFDLDRAPSIATSSFAPTREDTDFVNQYYVAGDGSATLPYTWRTFDANQDPEEDYSLNTYTAFTATSFNRFRMEVVLGGHAFNDQTSTVGDLQLHAGRTLLEPATLLIPTTE